MSDLLEEWRAVAGYVGIYQVSDWGRVKSLDRMTSDGRHIKGIMRKQCLDKDGYLYVSTGFGKDDKRHNLKVHSLVAQAFIGERPEGMQVNHKDTNKQNNNVWNLEYLTASGNIQHAYDTGLKSQKGILNNHNSLSEADVIEIRAIGDSQPRQITAKQFSVSTGHVGYILRGERWKHLVNV